MKLLCVADHIDPIVHSSQVKKRFHDADIVISAGDLPMRYLGFLAGSLNKPVLFVFGNHNLNYLNQFKKNNRPHMDLTSQLSHKILNYFGATYVGGKLIRIKGLIIGGLGGSYRYNKGENQYTEAQMRFKIIKMLPKLLWNRLVYKRYLDILVTHAPPRGIGDQEDICHRGFKTFLWFMRVFKPKYLLHGHVHLYDLNAERKARYANTTIINVYNHFVLEIDENKEEVGSKEKTDGHLHREKSG
ncbi:MAG: metallophosphoesterase [Spirochaetia bacterium]